MKFFPRLFFVMCFLMILTLAGFAEITLPKLVGDGMVLQRDVPIKLWGWAKPGEKISLKFNNRTYITNANTDSTWQLVLEQQNAGGPYNMIIRGENTIELKNILVGDVWLLSGQSQMDQTMERVSPLYPNEIKNAGNEMIRYFVVPTVYNFKSSQADIPYGHWESITQDNILRVAAISYFFANELHGHLNVPIGIIRSSLGGSPAQAWISEEVLNAFPVYYDEMQRFKSDSLIAGIEANDRNLSNQWYSKMNKADLAYSEKITWKMPAADISGWNTINIPAYWADAGLGMINGSVWFRKTIELPKHFEAKAAKLNMGTIVDADSVFVNGVFVGSTGYQYPPRRYNIPAGILKAGPNTVVVRVISNSGKGGFVPDKPYELIVNDESVDLKGTWLYRVGAEMEPAPEQTFVRWKPGGLYNGMIYPISNYNVKGVLWYQGESNTEKPDEYDELMSAMIKCWRSAFGQGNFPFIFAQLANYMESYDYPSESNWALTREAQLKTLSEPNTAMIVAIDLGEWNDIHPLNKKDVAQRYALAARKLAYNEQNLVASGPIYQSMQVKGNKIEITFSEIGTGLSIGSGDYLKHFAIAGADQQFVWANAVIDGNKVVVWNDGVQNPVAVRYAWANNPEGANLYNKEGLPASPFRTDNW